MRYEIGMQDIYARRREELLGRIGPRRVARELRAGERRGRRMPPRMADLRLTLHEQRLVKDEAALAALRRAVAITAEAHRLAMREARPGMHEYEIEALVEYTFRRRGAT